MVYRIIANCLIGKEESKKISSDPNVTTKKYKKGTKNITETTTKKGKKTIIEKVWREGKKVHTETTTKEGNRTSVNTFIKHDPTTMSSTTKKSSHTSKQSANKTPTESAGGTTTRNITSGRNKIQTDTTHGDKTFHSDSKQGDKKSARNVTYYQTITNSADEESKILDRSTSRGGGNKNTQKTTTTVHRSGSQGGGGVTSHSSTMKSGGGKVTKETVYRTSSKGGDGDMKVQSSSFRGEREYEGAGGMQGRNVTSHSSTMRNEGGGKVTTKTIYSTSNKGGDADMRVHSSSFRGEGEYDVEGNRIISRSSTVKNEGGKAFKDTIYRTSSRGEGEDGSMRIHSSSFRGEGEYEGAGGMGGSKITSRSSTMKNKGGKTFKETVYRTSSRGGDADMQVNSSSFREEGEYDASGNRIASHSSTMKSGGGKVITKTIYSTSNRGGDGNMQVHSSNIRGQGEFEGSGNKGHSHSSTIRSEGGKVIKETVYRTSNRGGDGDMKVHSSSFRGEGEYEGDGNMEGRKVTSHSSTMKNKGGKIIKESVYRTSSKGGDSDMKAHSSSFRGGDGGSSSSRVIKETVYRTSNKGGDGDMQVHSSSYRSGGGKDSSQQIREGKTVVSKTTYRSDGKGQSNIVGHSSNTREEGGMQEGEGSARRGRLVREVVYRAGDRGYDEGQSHSTSIKAEGGMGSSQRIKSSNTLVKETIYRSGTKGDNQVVEHSSSFKGEGSMRGGKMVKETIYRSSNRGGDAEMKDESKYMRSTGGGEGQYAFSSSGGEGRYIRSAGRDEDQYMRSSDQVDDQNLMSGRQEEKRYTYSADEGEDQYMQSTERAGGKYTFTTSEGEGRYINTADEGDMKYVRTSGEGGGEMKYMLRSGEGNDQYIHTSSGDGHQTTSYETKVVRRSGTEGGAKMTQHSSSYRAGSGTNKSIKRGELTTITEGTHRIADKRNKNKEATSTTNSVFSRLTQSTKSAIGKSKRANDKEVREQWRQNMNKKLEEEEEKMNMGGFVLKEQRYKKVADAKSPKPTKSSNYSKTFKQTSSKINANRTLTVDRNEAVSTSHAFTGEFSSN